MKVGELYTLDGRVVMLEYIYPHDPGFVVVSQRADPEVHIPAKASDLVPYDPRERNKRWRQIRIAEVLQQVRETGDCYLVVKGQRLARSTELHWLHVAGCKYNRDLGRWEAPAKPSQEPDP